MKLCSREESTVVIGTKYLNLGYLPSETLEQMIRQPHVNTFHSEGEGVDIRLVECWYACFVFFLDGLSVIFQGAPRKTTKKRQEGFTGDREEEGQTLSLPPICSAFPSSLLPFCPNSSTASLLSLPANQKHV